MSKNNRYHRVRTPVRPDSTVEIDYEPVGGEDGVVVEPRFTTSAQAKTLFGPYLVTIRAHSPIPPGDGIWYKWKEVHQLIDLLHPALGEMTVRVLVGTRDMFRMHETPFGTLKRERVNRRVDLPSQT